jgi:hypothetical protein
MIETTWRGILRGGLVLHLAFIAAVTGMAVRAEEPNVVVFEISYRSADTIYLEGGRARGLVVGDRLEVVRGDQTIAEIEVIFVAEHSASCKILSERETIAVDDRVVMQGGGAPADTSPDAAAAAAATAVVAAPGQDSVAPAPRRKRTRVSGSITFDWERFTDDSGRGLDYDRTAARLNLFVRDMGGKPYALVVRAQALEWDRARALGPLVPQNDDRNRLFEASFTYAPPQGRFAYSVGRLGTAPFVGIGYLDGVLGQVYLGAGFDFGAFFGKGVEFRDLEFAELGTKYGAYTRYRSNRAGPKGFEIYVAGVRENGDEEVSREYAAIDIRYRGVGSWIFSQHTEIDFNRDWREELSSDSTQISNLNLIAAGQLAPAWRLIITYDRNQRYRTVENRLVPEALFDDLSRQGLRARVQYGRPGKIRVSLNVGARERQDDSDSTTSAGLNVYHPNVGIRGLLIGGTVNAFSNPLTDAYLANIRISKTFGRGHEIRLLVGALHQEYKNFSSELDTQYARLGGWVELPVRMFFRAEIEYNTGDDLEGSRVNAGLGYRF